jgi:uncharacterized protein YraI
VRSGPGTNYSIVATLSNGAIVDIVDDSQPDWLNVKLPDGRVGWVSASLIHIPLADFIVSSFAAVIRSPPVTLVKSA